MTAATQRVNNTDPLGRAQARLGPLLEDAIERLDHRSQPLGDAIRHSLLAPSKAVRPALVWASCEALATDPTLGDRAAVAVECIHTYSLIHDDLPAMDDDALRRGQPSCHVVFGEAEAILAGDALQALAFEALADPAWPLMPQGQLAASVTALARAAGGAGMVDGQSLDLLAENHAAELSELELVHSRKTGALIRASCELGGLSAGADPMQLDSLIQIGQTLGFAFQVQDDVLDVTQSTTALGKPAGSDTQQNKSTFVTLLGVEQCQDLVQDLFAGVRDLASSLPNPQPILAIVDRLAQRSA